MTIALLSLLLPSLSFAPSAELDGSLHAASPRTAPVVEGRMVPTSDPPARIERHLELAQRAASQGRVSTAVDHIRIGLNITSRSRGVAYDKARLETWAVAWREQVVLASLAAGQVEEARELLQRLSDPLDSTFADDRADELRQRVLAAEQAQSNARGRVSPLRAKMLRRIDKSEQVFARAERDLRRAERNSRRTVYSARRAQAALRRWLAIEEDVEQWLREPGLDPRTTHELIALRIRAEDHALRAILRIANARTTQGDFREALSWVDRAELRAPDNQDARELRRTIQIASAASAAWIGWGPAMPIGSQGGR